MNQPQLIQKSQTQISSGLPVNQREEANHLAPKQLVCTCYTLHITYR